jgi:WD40 repeat protein
MLLDAATLAPLFDPKNKSAVQLKPDRQLNQVRFTPCGKYLLGAGHDGRVHRWDLSGETPVEIPALDGHRGWVQAVVCRAEGELVISADSWGQLRCGAYAGEHPAAAWTIPNAHDGWIVGLALSLDGRQLATGGHDRAVRLWHADSGEKLREFREHRVEVFSVAWAPDGQTVFSGDLHGRVIQWSAADGSLLREFDASVLHASNRLQEVGGARTLAVSATTNQLLVGGTKPKNGGNVQGVPTVLVFDIPTGALAKTFELGKDGDVYVTDLALLADGTWAATISGNPGTGKVVFFRLDAEQPIFEHTRLPNCHSIAGHPDGRRFAISATNAGSNGNGRNLDKDGKYPGNYSPIHLFTLTN